MSFSRLKTIVFGVLASVGFAIGAAAGAQANTQASIPFANHGGIYDWRANGTHGIWVQAANRDWYYGTFMNSCIGLDRAINIGFVTEPTGDFDRWSSIIVPHEFIRCHLSSFERSGEPPERGGSVVG